MIGRIEQQAADVAARDNEGISCDGQDVEGVMEEGEGADVMCELMSGSRGARGGGGGGGLFLSALNPPPTPVSPDQLGSNFLRFSILSPPPPRPPCQTTSMTEFTVLSIVFYSIIKSSTHTPSLSLPSSKLLIESKCISRQPGPPTPPNISLPIDLSVQLGYKETEKASIWGPTCDSIDCVREVVRLPSGLEVGDWLGWGEMGAYTSCAASTFNG